MDEADLFPQCSTCGGTGIVVSIAEQETANQVAIPGMDQDVRSLRFGLSSSGAPCIYGPPMRFALCSCVRTLLLRALYFEAGNGA